MRDLYRSITEQIHPASLLLVIAFDVLWSLVELGTSVFGLVCLMPLMSGMIFFACWGAVALVQRNASRDEWSAASSKGLALGILAALPFSFVGFIGGAVLGVMHLVYGVDEETILLGKLTRSWREIEGTLRRLASPDVRSGSMDDVIDSLYNRRLLSNDLRDRLHELRRQRNTNMHEFTTDELSELVEAIQGMENTLHARFYRL